MSSSFIAALSDEKQRLVADQIRQTVDKLGARFDFRIARSSRLAPRRLVARLASRGRGAAHHGADHISSSAKPGPPARERGGQLDDLGFEADASSSGTGGELVLSVEVVVDGSDPLEAQAIGIGTIVQALRAGEVDVADLAPTGLVTSTQTLQPA